MKTLVLDKSTLEAAPKGFLQDRRGEFHFLLPGHLLHELATEKLAQRHFMSPSEKEALDYKLQFLFKKAIHEAGGQWIGHTEALEWEITQGRSSRGMPTRDLSSLRSFKDLLQGKVLDHCNELEAIYATAASVPHDPRMERDFRELQCTPEADLLKNFADKARSQEYVMLLSQRASTLADLAPQKGWTVSPNFHPGPGWFAYGMTLAGSLYLQWKWCKFGDAPADRKKPANPVFDLYYIAFMAITDGLLSSDTGMLELAWAAWPEKREDIYQYRMEKSALVRFNP